MSAPTATDTFASVQCLGTQVRAKISFTPCAITLLELRLRAKIQCCPAEPVGGVSYRRYRQPSPVFDISMPAVRTTNPASVIIFENEPEIVQVAGERGAMEI